MINSVINYLYEIAGPLEDKCCIVEKLEELSFGQFMRKAFIIAKMILDEKKINQPIAVYLPKSIPAVVSFAGILLSGNIYVPLDINSPKKRLKSILNNLKAYRIICSAEKSTELYDLGFTKNSVIIYEKIINSDKYYDLNTIIETCRKITDKIIDMDPCYVMHTSGSTGVPKGVVIPHRGVVDYITWAIKCLGINKLDIIGNQAPLYFDNSTLDIYLSWATGATLDLIPDDKFIFPPKLIEYIETHKITFVFFVPTVLINISKFKLLSLKSLPKLKKIVFAGEVMPTKHLAYWQEKLPDRLYANLYGPTEITVDCTYFILDRKYESHEILPIGYPCHNSGIIILNDKDKEVGAGERGELCVRGSSLALGYWNNEEKTKEAFIQNPLQKNYIDPIYRTGDIVYKDAEGKIIFVGRKDFQIKHLGNRIELGEIENAAIVIPNIENSCALYNKKKNEITLFLETKKDMMKNEIYLILSKSLPNYMTPRKLYLVKEIPLNQNGKIDRKALQEKYF